MPNYKDLPQELTRTRTNEAVSELVDLKVHTATDIEAQEVSKEQAKDMYKTMWDIRNFEENARRYVSLQRGKFLVLFICMQVKKP